LSKLLEAEKLGTLKSQYAIMVRHYGADSPQAHAAEAKFAAEKATIQIRRILATKPPLSAAQTAELAALVLASTATTAVPDGA
jgi:bisphosphoglycerate-dependent phosphoglycerate mutase